ncbi:hypothetical protein B5F40_10610 [Gordonibacter sp. An230]|uniref:hypothetical protein n=1 Tax=Gordonibacter sp. An230 TaxID=1965592 RepID=UPI000B36BFE9|nr:hypothetical protein [Gordonibacter sp. An230]OUO89549.1 hypothetical protein B5F40_10610 [Gordonibacter sp. An230]
MSMKGLSAFQSFDLDKFLTGKTLVFVKAEQWDERDSTGAVSGVLGSKITVMVTQDATDYGTGREVSNFGGQFIVKVRDTSPSAYSKLKPFSTEVIVESVERAVIWGDFKNELSVIAKIAVKG